MNAAIPLIALHALPSNTTEKHEAFVALVEWLRRNAAATRRDRAARYTGKTDPIVFGGPVEVTTYRHGSSTRVRIVRADGDGEVLYDDSASDLLQLALSTLRIAIRARKG